jgi:Fe-S-cluster containining protein
MTQVSASGDDPRREPFGYLCRRCLNCCHAKHIQLNPYEVARLARNRGVSTTEFRQRYTFEGAGVALSQTGDDAACVFLGPEGCEVHPDRPLVCRLYPLGRHVDAEGAERFSHVAPHPLSQGELTRDGTIADYLEAQGAGPFIHAADAYLAWLVRALAATPGAAEVIGSSQDGADDLLDMDVAIARRCETTGETPPVDVEARMRLHLEILYGLLSETKGSET